MAARNHTGFQPFNYTLYHLPVSLKCQKSLKIAILDFKMAMELSDFKMVIAILSPKIAILDFKMALNLFKNVF